MILILQATMKTIYVLEFRNPTQILLLIILYTRTFNYKKTKSTFTPELTSAIDVKTNSELYSMNTNPFSLYTKNTFSSETHQPTAK